MSDMDFENATAGAGHNSGSVVDVLREHCSEAIELEEVISGYEDALKAAKSRLHHLRTVKIPETMVEAGIGDVFSMASGHEIALSQFVSGSLPKDIDQRAAAFDYIGELGGEAIIKADVKLQFGKGEIEEAQQAIEALHEAGYDDALLSENVHPQTLYSFVRDKMEDGEEIDLDKLGVYTGTIAKIKAPKKGKK